MGYKSTCGTAQFSPLENDLVYRVSFAAAVFAAWCRLWAVNFHATCEQTEIYNWRRLGLAFLLSCSSTKGYRSLWETTTQTHTDTHTHVFIHSMPSLGRGPVWQGQTLRRGGGCDIDPDPQSVNQAARCGTGMTNIRCLIPPRARLYITPTPRRESSACTLLTSIVFQRQPPGGKLGKQLIHPHAVHKQAVKEYK